MASPSDLSGLLSWFTSTTGLWDATSGGSAVTSDLAQIASWEPTAGSVAGRMTQASAANRPVYDATEAALSFSVGPGGLNHVFNPNTFTFSRQAFSLFAVVRITSLRSTVVSGSNIQYRTFLTCSGDDPDFYMEGITAGRQGKLAFYESGEKPTANIPLAGRYVLIGWVCDTTGAWTWFNSSKASIAALSSGTATPAAVFGGTGTFPCQCDVKDLFYYSRAVSDSEVTTTLLPYALTRGVSTSLSGQIQSIGDSQGLAYGAHANRGWQKLLTGYDTYRMQITNQYAINLESLYTDRAFDEANIIAGETNALVLWAGTNDIANLGKTAAQVYSRMGDYVTSWRTAITAAGATGKVVGVTPLPRGGGSIAGEYAALRNTIMGDASHLFDAVADPTGYSTLNAVWGDGTYDFDTIHPNDFGYANAVVPRIKAALDSLLSPPPPPPPPPPPAAPNVGTQFQTPGGRSGLPMGYTFAPSSARPGTLKLQVPYPEIHPAGALTAAFAATQVLMPPFPNNAIVPGPWQTFRFRAETRGFDNHVPPPPPPQVYPPPFPTAAPVRGPWNLFRGPVGLGALAGLGQAPVPPPVGPPPPPPPPQAGAIGGARTQVPRVPVDINMPMGRLRSHTQKVAGLLNSLLRQGYIKLTGDDEYAIVGGGFNLPRAPVASDDASKGAVVGGTFIDTLNNDVYICTNNSVGSAIWRKISLS